MTHALFASGSESEEAPPLVRSAAVLGGSAVGAGLLVVAGSLWTALAFSDGHSTFFNHLPWWYGTTFMVAVIVGSFMAGLFSRTRGLAAGAANGLSTAGVLVTIGAIAALASDAVNGALAPVFIHGAAVNVQLITPWVAFVSALVGLGAAGIVGVAGGIVPRPLLARRSTSDRSRVVTVPDSPSRAA